MLPLHTPRLTLRRFTAADVDGFLAYRNDPVVARYQSWEGCSRIEAEAFIQAQEKQEAGMRGKWLQIAIARRKDGTLLGDCAVQVHATCAQQASIGITLAQQSQGHGFATEALTALVDVLFRQWRLHRVVADTDPQNVPAWSLLERLGMRREAHLRESVWFKGRWADEYVYGLLAKEWMARCKDMDDG